MVENYKESNLSNEDIKKYDIREPVRILEIYKKLKELGVKGHLTGSLERKVNDN